MVRGANFRTASSREYSLSRFEGINSYFGVRTGFAEIDLFRPEKSNGSEIRSLEEGEPFSCKAILLC